MRSENFNSVMQHDIILSGELQRVMSLLNRNGIVVTRIV